MMQPAQLSFSLSDDQVVSALRMDAPDAFACLVLAHGAGAGMRHPFMAAVAEGLARRGVSTLRYQFPYIEAGSKRVDRPPLAHLTVRAAVAAAGISLPLFAGGKSFGGRMTSQAQAIDPLPSVRGLVFFGFPLHPAGKPSTERSVHLSDARVPMLFLQGTRDALAEIGLIEGVMAGLGAAATLVAIDDADHSFHVPAKSGRKDSSVLDELLDEAANWMRSLA
jgi:predicted alpha/beta-hydrolase family hydrolase